MVLILPGIPAPASAPSVDISALAPAGQPLGNVRALIDRLTGSYSVAQMAAIRRAHALLAEGDVLVALDCLSFKMGNEDDSLLNWAGNTNAVNNGATFTPAGFNLDGVDDWIDPQADVSGAANYRQDNAHFGVYVSEDLGVSRFPAIGAPFSSASLFPRWNGVNGDTRFRINSDTNTDVNSGLPVVGLWSAGTLANESRQYLFHGAGSVASAVVTFNIMPTALRIGRHINEYAAMSTAGWFVSRFLNGARRSAISRAFEVMRAAFVVPA